MVSLKLKPLNGWRHFFGEVGIIILGVLVALGLGAIATEIGWRLEAREARKAIGLELGEAVGQAIERTKFLPCVERRLDELAVLLDRASSTGRLPPIGDIAIPAIRTWTHGTWDSAVSAQTAAHLGRHELKAYVGAYEYITRLGETNQQEVEVWTRLYPLVGPGRALYPAEAAALRLAISEARITNRRITRTGVRLTQVVDAYDLPFDDAHKREFSDNPMSDYDICQPIGAEAPAHYGQAPRQYTVESVQKDPITRVAN